MNPASIDDLLKIVPNKYLLTMVIAARAKQLEKGAESLVNYESSNTLDIAIKEIAAGLIDVNEVIAQSNKILEQEIMKSEDLDEADFIVSEFVDM
jgi:DNA-directed RNA polymerase omega subunit